MTKRHFARFSLTTTLKTAADQGIGFYAQSFVRTSLFFAAPFTMRQRVRFSTQNQGFQCSLFLCELSFKRYFIKALGYILKTYIRTSVFFVGRFTLSQSSPPVRNTTYLRTFFNNLFMCFERFCQPACFFAARFTLRQPKTPVRNATNLQTFCFSDYHYAFQETLCPVTLAY